MGTCLESCLIAVLMGGGVAAGWQGEKQKLAPTDMNSTTLITRSVLFGGAIGLISCYKGFHCKPGAEGVGRACTEAFVISFIMILVLDFFLNLVINGLYEGLYGPRPLLF